MIPNERKIGFLENEKEEDEWREIRAQKIEVFDFYACFLCVWFLLAFFEMCTMKGILELKERIGKEEEKNNRTNTYTYKHQ